MNAQRDKSDAKQRNLLIPLKVRIAVGTRCENHPPIIRLFNFLGALFVVLLVPSI